MTRSKIMLALDDVHLAERSSSNPKGILREDAVKQACSAHGLDASDEAILRRATNTPPSEPAIVVEASVPLSRIASLLVSGLESGAGYWLRIESYEQPVEPVIAHLEGMDGEVFRHVDWPLTKGGALILRDTEDRSRGPLRLDLDAIRRGLVLMQSKSPTHWGDFIAEDDDATTGDVFLQYALLGDLVYG